MAFTLLQVNSEVPAGVTAVPTGTVDCRVPMRLRLLCSADVMEMPSLEEWWQGWVGLLRGSSRDTL